MKRGIFLAILLTVSCCDFGVAEDEGLLATSGTLTTEEASRAAPGAPSAQESGPGPTSNGPTLAPVQVSQGGDGSCVQVPLSNGMVCRSGRWVPASPKHGDPDPWQPTDPKPF